MCLEETYPGNISRRETFKEGTGRGNKLQLNQAGRKGPGLG